jgi:hypothetical protein
MAAVHRGRKVATILTTEVTGYNRLTGEAEEAIGRIGWPKKSSCGHQGEGAYMCNHSIAYVKLNSRERTSRFGRDIL